uniref:Cuticular protein PpolCPG5 n=1 Tax=Papilio polytes TaxID=76194 RepID=I4DM02_PAPPL|nr:cuticular protein PpolCPG5 [Papilio polytes]
MKFFAGFVAVLALVGAAAAGFIGSGWSSPVVYSRPAVVYSRPAVVYSPSYYGGHGYGGLGYGGRGYGGWSSGWRSGWW